MGGHMQHQGHVQMVNRIFDHRQNPQAASDAPRWHVFEDFSVGLETGFPIVGRRRARSARPLGALRDQHKRCSAAPS